MCIYIYTYTSYTHIIYIYSKTLFHFFVDLPSIFQFVGGLSDGKPNSRVDSLMNKRPWSSSDLPDVWWIATY